VEASFHLTITACVAATGFVVPPLSVVPRQRLNRDKMDKCEVLESTVSVVNKGFMNSALFIKWLEHFERNVLGSVLVYDGYGSHHSDDIVA